ncbi:hypothetical protein H9I45_08250 [Polaribacter haliotis]|uniref:Uncharacterized protein n=1 Tax=Polaribacter haliotis TaxID=1888915 RepID=A0A7L8ABH4_9FLAO|nr:hypothetical protein [Polaribacter haliotis]QOD59368.1 hypothetical protein H9I45_08250 [Polaribacter haliotis]
MANKKNYNSENKDKNTNFDFFENYNNNVEVVGFRTSWISEFKDEMKSIYEGGKKSEKK